MTKDVVGVVVRLSAKSDVVDEFVELAQRTMVGPTQAAPGCIRYELWQDLEDPAVFTIIEEWESEEAHAGHLASEWLQPVIAALQPFAASQFEMQRLRKSS